MKKRANVTERAVAAQRKRYAGVDHAKGPASYWKASGYDLLYKFAMFERGKKHNVLDLMSGAGKVGKEMAKRAQKNHCSVFTTFCDITPHFLKSIRKTWTRTTRERSAFRTLEWEGNFQRVFCRYGIKNYTPSEQVNLLKEIARVLSPGGRFILQDMVSPEGLRGFMNAERRAKARTAGDRVSKPNLPTEREWRRMIAKAGMEVEDVAYTTSKVNTNDWVASGQMSADKVRGYISFLERAMAKDPRIKKAFKITKKGKHYEIIYPVILIRAAKEMV